MKFNISARRAAVAALPALAIAFCGLPAALAQSVPDPAQPWNWSEEFVLPGKSSPRGTEFEPRFLARRGTGCRAAIL
jgi:hypothetical protein